MYTYVHTYIYRIDIVCICTIAFAKIRVMPEACHKFAYIVDGEEPTQMPIGLRLLSIIFLWEAATLAEAQADR